jgi:hypothetical protein
MKSGFYNVPGDRLREKAAFPWYDDYVYIGENNDCQNKIHHM